MYLVDGAGAAAATTLLGGIRASRLSLSVLEAVPSSSSCSSSPLFSRLDEEEDEESEDGDSSFLYTFSLSLSEQVEQVWSTSEQAPD